MTLIMSLNGLVLCPFQGILDIANQLSTTDDDIIRRVFEPVYELNTINDWVNVDDSLGDLTVIRAQELVARLCSLYKINATQSLEIHIDLGDSSLTIDNYWALIFLSEAMNNLAIFFYLSPQKIAETQALTKHLHERENCVTHYRHAKFFTENATWVQISEELKTKRNGVLSQQGYKLEALSDEKFDSALFPLISLISYSWACLQAGSYPLGCQVLSSLLARSELDSLVFEEIFVHLQIIRFLSHQHHLVVGDTFPESFQFVNQERIKHLYFIKAFSATLTRNLPIAEDYFKKAEISQTMTMTDEASLYKLNLYALFLLLKDDADNAFQLETKLQAYIQSYHSNAASLHHVVFMNIARLYKKSKEYKLSAEYYAKAYEQLSSGGFTLFDHISHSMDLAILDEARGRVKEALFSWVKVAIHWLSCPNPYALAVRQRLVLCQENITQTLMPISREKVNSFLLEKLNYLSVLANITYDASENSVYCFVSDDDINIQKHACYVANNLIIYSCSLPINQQYRPCSAIETSLHRVISSLIKISMPTISTEPQCIAVDTKHDCFYPKSKEESLALALLSKCTSCFYNGKEVLMDSPRLLDNLEVIPSKMITSMETTEKGLQVVYKRSFLNKLLETPEEIDFVKNLNLNLSPQGAQVKDYCPDVLMRLFSKKVISFDFNLEKA